MSANLSSKESSSAAASSTQERVMNKVRGNLIQAGTILTQDDVFEHFYALLNTYEDLKTAHQTLQAEKFFLPVLKSCLTPFTLDRLSVFAEQYSVAYSQHIFCGWLAVLIARDMKFDAKTAVKACSAAMARDFGMLYLPEKLLDESARYTPDDWNALKTHPIIGELAVRDVGGFEPEVARAVLEHHERYDGVGYPKGLLGDRISLLGQIVGAVDTVCAIRFKRFKHSGRNLRDVYAYVQMGANAYSQKINTSLYNVLVNNGVEKTFVNPFKTVKDLIYHLYVRAAAMNGAIHLLEKLIDTLPFFKPGPLRNGLKKQTEQVLEMIKQSGILDDKMVSWLNSLDRDFDTAKANISELSEIELLQNELYWHLFRVSDAIEAFHEKEMTKSSPSASTITMILKYLSEKNLPRAAESMGRK